MGNPNIKELGQQKPSDLTKEKIRLGTMESGLRRTEATYADKLEKKRQAIEAQRELVDRMSAEEAEN